MLSVKLSVVWRNGTTRVLVTWLLIQFINLQPKAPFK